MFARSTELLTRHRRRLVRGREDKRVSGRAASPTARRGLLSPLKQHVELVTQLGYRTLIEEVCLR